MHGRKNIKCNTHCFSITKMVARTRLIVTLYVQYTGCLFMVVLRYPFLLFALLRHLYFYAEKTPYIITISFTPIFL